MAERVVLRRALPRDLLGVRAVSETHRQIVTRVLEKEAVGKLSARVAQLEADVAALKRCVPNGTSTFRWEEGEYEGAWQGHLLEDTCPEEAWYEKRPHGRGSWTGANGSVYEGSYVDGQRHGEGKFTYPDGGFYVGGFERGKKSGAGKYTDPRGVVVYDGQWKDKEHGEGKFIYPGGETYEGQFVMGKKEGKAVYTEPSGNRYEGEFVDGKREGKGRYTYPDGSVAHDGMWKDGQPVHG